MLKWLLTDWEYSSNGRVGLAKLPWELIDVSDQMSCNASALQKLWPLLPVCRSGDGFAGVIQLQLACMLRVPSLWCNTGQLFLSDWLVTILSDAISLTTGQCWVISKAREEVPVICNCAEFYKSDRPHFSEMLWAQIHMSSHWVACTTGQTKSDVYKSWCTFSKEINSSSRIGEALEGQ
jgi:hypothetical protein